MDSIMMKRFESLVREHRNAIYTFAVYNLGNHEEAEDATQEVLIKLWKHIDSLGQDSLASWLRRVTRNACIDLMRRRRAYTTRVVAAGDSDIVASAVSHEPGPDEVLETGRLRGHIARALSKLEEPYRSIVILREVQDLKYEEISETMEMPLNTVKSYLHRGRRLLRNQLRGYVDEY
jgi:RNA polymerase sigma factor (sigma-70 family)